MAKGFGTSSANSPIGYILLIIPEEKIYAADDPLGNNDEYSGITDSIEMARLWQKKKDVQKSLGTFIEWVAEDYYQNSRDSIDMEIRALYKDKDGKLHTKLVQSLVIEKRFI
ncbi:hypothetical protein IQ225_10070 [Synechocystis salina LEGE 06155]|nr:hypothetical protein [Synechocystis salina LEGE 06155]